MGIRPMAAADAERVLELNEESVKELSPLDSDSVEWHRRNAAAAVVYDRAGEVLAFALAHAPGSPYESVNYRWHSDHFAEFLYLDRIAVSSRVRRQGIASALYDAMEAAAARHGRMVCEVYCDPPNEESLAFHERRGYREVGHLTQPNGRESVLLEKPL